MPECAKCIFNFFEKFDIFSFISTYQIITKTHRHVYMAAYSLACMNAIFRDKSDICPSNTY